MAPAAAWSMAISFWASLLVVVIISLEKWDFIPIGGGSVSLFPPDFQLFTDHGGDFQGGDNSLSVLSVQSVQLYRRDREKVSIPTHTPQCSMQLGGVGAVRSQNVSTCGHFGHYVKSL